MTDRRTRILLQTTIPPTADDWSIARFSRLGKLLRDQPAFEVVMRDRDPMGAPDSILSTLDKSVFDELWLFAVDTGDGLTVEDCEAISRFRRAGKGLLVTRDHMDLGSSVCSLAGVGLAHHFHSHNLDPDETAHQIDDPYSTNISWPNYHSGANGDFQEIEVLAPTHPLLATRTGQLHYLPAHPHEGAVGAPAGENARIIARGKSKVSGRPFNIAVAFEPGVSGGPAIAQSTFHHFADYNWDPRDGAPSFVDEPPGDAILRTPQAIAYTQAYALNAAYWLAGRTHPSV